MCGIVAHAGIVDDKIVSRLVKESTVRGLHHIGYKKIADGAIYHARYITSGFSNQPLSIDDGRWLAFNGVIDMGTKEEIESRYGIKMSSDNDGEIVLRLCKNDQDIVNFLKNSKCTFAGVVIDNESIVAIRNPGRPLWISQHQFGFYLASTKDIFKRSGIFDPVELEPYKVYKFGLNNKEIY